MVYDNLNEYEKAIEYYDKVIYEFKTTDGKSEFLKGLLLVKTKKQEDGCSYLRISAQKLQGLSTYLPLMFIHHFAWVITVVNKINQFTIFIINLP